MLKDSSRDFVIVIPVADRPQHLKDCLASLLQLCRTFGYATDSRLRVSALIADDSKEAENQALNREIAREVSAQGVAVSYFGLAEQMSLLDAIEQGRVADLSRILGTIDTQAFYHKGASITRNLAYLRLAQIALLAPDTLFWFIDSDQEFRVNTDAEDYQPLDYLHHIDQIFSSLPVQILTGKVVGDPPVSPSVMAGNFLEDVLAFMHQMAAHEASGACSFHGKADTRPDHAAYHDMAALFGFQPEQAAFDYPCPLTVEHDHAQCLAQFSANLDRFFHGEHPTRKTHFQHEDALASVRPARTVYTGNYVINAQALRYFIPFATLKLRMAGPVLGRIAQSELGSGFVSANLPMLHKRTVGATGQAEFRPGVRVASEKIDLSGEFERQFYGDVMLFTIAKLCDAGYPAEIPDSAQIAESLRQTHANLQAQYDEQRHTILSRLSALRALVANPAAWWNRTQDQAESIALIHAFMDNIASNFETPAIGYALIHDASHQAARHAEMIEAIRHYPADRLEWEKQLTVMANRRPTS
ncbi:MAG: hypothetical protein Q8O37_08255 [Sulfuricellaceae bacterium]|nr:hypothetical protein [Sulfuricellaceae bacterium]